MPSPSKYSASRFTGIGDPSVDLLVGSVGRTYEVARLLETLAAQSYRNFRVIILDQNDDRRLDAIVERHRDALSIEQVRVPPGGRSRAMNRGLELTEADVIGFPDDDCWYPPGLLGHVVGTLYTQPKWHGLSGRTVDEEGRPTQLRWDTMRGPVTKRTLFRRSIACTTFYRREVIETVGRFDETFGIRIAPSGEIIGAGEESDYLLRALAAGFSHLYDPATVVYHDSYSPHVLDSVTLRKSYSFGIDHTRLLKLHGYPHRFVLWRAAQLVIASLVFLLRGSPGRARFYSAMARGRLRGIYLFRRPKAHHKRLRL
jgi:glycosyltransferase involved in cell wall biosynthesis